MAEIVASRSIESSGLEPNSNCRFRCVVGDESTFIEVLRPSQDAERIQLRLSKPPFNIVDRALTAVEFLSDANFASFTYGTHEYLSSVANIVMQALPATTSPEEAHAVIEELFEATGRLLDAAQLHDALTLWMRWLVVPNPSLAGFKSFPRVETYFKRLLRAFMQSEHSNHQKFCLAILRASIDRLEADSDSELLRYHHTQKTHYVKAYAEYCSLFEIIVMGRYVNQIQECLVLLPSSQRGKQSLVQDVWWLLLFRAALESNNEQIRKMLGTWLLKCYVVKPTTEDCIMPVSAALFDSLLSWGTYGQLAYKSVVRDERTVRSEHGDLLSAFCVKQAQENHAFAEHALGWLRSHAGTLNQHTTAYVLRGLSNAEATFGMSKNAAHLADSINFSPLLRLITRRYCLQIMEKHISDGAAPSDPSLKAIGNLHSQIERSFDFLDGEIGPFLLSPNHAAQLKDHASTVFERLVAKNYIQEHGSVIVINWDRLTRYDPHQALWKLLAECWPYWVDNLVRHGSSKDDITNFVADCISNFFRLSRRKTFVWNATARALRNMYFGAMPDILQHPEVEMALLNCINEPPSPTPEYLLDEAVAAGEVDESGKQLYNICADETLGHAYVFGMLNRLRPEDQTWGLCVLDKLLGPWQSQKEPIPVVSKWKRTSQLQAMIILLRSCVHTEEAIQKYSSIFYDLLAKDPNPRIRFLLEWAVLCLASQQSSDAYTNEALEALERSEPSNPNSKLVASQIKVAVQLALHHPSSSGSHLQRAQLLERLLTILTTLIGSSRVPIRFEAQATFPTVFDYARNELLLDSMDCAPVFQSVYKFVTSLDKYKDPPEPRVLTAFNIRKDMNLATLFEGGYLFVPQSEPPLLYARDLLEIVEKDETEIANMRPEAHLPIGSIDADAAALIAKLKAASSKTAKIAPETPDITHGPLQTKSLAADLSTLFLDDIDTAATKQGTGPILVGTLLEAPVNLGGLSRAANVFGCHSLHIPSLAILQSSQFKNVSVDSELHIDVQETKAGDLLTQLRDLKAEGWTVVGLEQTSDSVVIGVPGEASENDGGGKKKLPRKAVIVMGAESTGIPADVLFECDVCVEIKQWGVTRSLNVQTAAACVLFEWRREWGDGTAFEQTHTLKR